MQKIICFRIDDRLIHGQVAAVWSKYLKPTRIVVVDDAANVDDLQKQMLRLACPMGVKLSVLSIDKTINNFNNNKYDGDSILMISRGPATIVELLERGFQHMNEEVIVGNISGSASKRQIQKGVNVDDDDVRNINELVRKGINVVCQLVPNEDKRNIVNLL